MKENPKLIQALKDGKVPLELIPFAALEGVARVLATGAKKYGERNWRIDKIKASTYIAAASRHILLEWAEGVDADHDSGEHPLDHAIAGLMIVRDAMKHGTLIDDRDRAESKAVQQDSPTRPSSTLGELTPAADLPPINFTRHAGILGANRAFIIENPMDMGLSPSAVKAGTHVFALWDEELNRWRVKQAGMDFNIWQNDIELGYVTHT